MLNELFRKFTRHAVNTVGSAWGFLLAAIIVAAWIISGWYFHYASFWEAIFNLGMSVVTFLLLFIIQHKQNRDATAINIKLDELILATKNARNTVIDAENLPDKELEEHKEHQMKHKGKKLKGENINKKP